MTINLPVFLRAWSILLLSASLVSCTSSPSDVPEASSSPSANPSPNSASASPSTPTIAQAPPYESLPSANPRTTSNEPNIPSSKTTATDPGRQPEASEPSVEAATVQPPASTGETTGAGDPTFQANSPSLAHLKLGYTDKDVVKRYGMPEDTYLMPGDDETIEIWEYDGLSVGLNEKDKVVYIEIASKKVDTGIVDLDYGMKGALAAELLGIPEGDRTNVLSLEVTGGRLKIDLDPDTQNVLAFKLIHRDF